MQSSRGSDTMAIRWSNTLDEALAHAKEQDRPLYVDFFSPT